MHLGNNISVKVNKYKLIETLKANLEKHVEAHKKALEVWRERAANKLQELSEKVRDGKVRSIDVMSISDVPTSYAPSYESVIDMLSYCDDVILELTSEDFSRYVQDKWEWKQSFLSNSSKYGG